MDNDYKYIIDSNKISILLDNVSIGEINYSLKNNVMDLYRVYVSPNYRGMDIARLLTKWTFEYAKDNHYSIKPTCPYIKDVFLKRNFI